MSKLYVKNGIVRTAKTEAQLQDAVKKGAKEFKPKEKKKPGRPPKVEE